MNQFGNIVEHIGTLVGAFMPVCADTSTLEKLEEYARNRARWRDCHSLFQTIRSKTLRAERAGNTAEIAQYKFEEACAKTLYNLCQSTAPFDVDSPYWIVPEAIIFARQIGVSEELVLGIVTRMHTASEVKL